MFIHFLRVNLYCKYIESKTLRIYIIIHFHKYISFHRYLFQTNQDLFINCFNIKSAFQVTGIPNIKIRWPWDHHTFITGILLLIFLHIYIKTAPRSYKYSSKQTIMCQNWAKTVPISSTLARFWPRELFYYSDLMLSQASYPMAAQLSNESCTTIG